MKKDNSTDKKNHQPKVQKPLVKRRNKSTEETDNNQKKGTKKTGLLANVFNVSNPQRQQNKQDKKKQKNYQSKTKKRGFTFFGKAYGASSRGGLDSDKYRFISIWVIMFVFFSILIARATWLQIINPKMYQEKGEQFITTTITKPAYRGIITDRNNHPLAVSAPLSTVIFSPHDYAKKYYALKKEILNTDNQDKLKDLNKQLADIDLNILAAAANINVGKLQEATHLNDNIDFNNEKKVKENLPSGNGSHYFLIFHKEIPEIADSVTMLNFPGIIEEKFFRRFYPQSQPNAQLIGFMGSNTDDPEYKGRAGLEKLYQSRLSGEDGKILVLKDARRTPLKVLKQLKPEIPGEDLQLTIDSRLQYLMYKELEKVGRIQEALWASGIVVDVQTGEILALSSWPTFNANDLGHASGASQRNRIFLDNFEPGSVIKPFTVATALESGKYNTNSLIDTSPGRMRVQGYNISDHANYGMINLATLLKKSSNVASTKIAFSLEPDAISNMQREFGFGKKTTLNFPGESTGSIVTPKRREMARRATISYGYGLEVTMAQLVQAYAALGSGGVLHPLRILKNDEPPVPTQIISRENALSIVEMMESVTSEGGTATAAAIDGYRVAGKTGTSRRVNPEGGYHKDQHRTIFAGIAPVSNPRLAAVILVENPQKQSYGGQVAAPVFHNVMKDALRLYNVPLDKPLSQNNN